MRENLNSNDNTQLLLQLVLHFSSNDNWQEPVPTDFLQSWITGDTYNLNGTARSK